MRGDSLNGQLTKLVSELVNRGLTLEQARREFEKQFILASLRTNNGNLSRSAKLLGVHRNTLRNKVSTLGICSDDLASSQPSRRKSAARPRASSARS